MIGDPSWKKSAQAFTERISEALETAALLAPKAYGRLREALRSIIVWPSKSTLPPV
jgi:hypothetical protein